MLGTQSPATARLQLGPVQCVLPTPSKLHRRTAIQRARRSPRAGKGSLSAGIARLLHDRAPAAVQGCTKTRPDTARLRAKNSQCAAKVPGLLARQPPSGRARPAEPARFNHLRATVTPRALLQRRAWQPKSRPKHQRPAQIGYVPVHASAISPLSTKQKRKQTQPIESVCQSQLATLASLSA